MTAAASRHRKMIRAVHAERAIAVRERLREFREVPRSLYLYELIYCLLTPQSNARHAAAVVTQLRERNFAQAPFDAEPLLREPRQYIRFHRTKAARLARIVHDFPDVAALLDEGLPPETLRDRLVERVDGLGMKEATHFMRNIGRNDGLAILDRHILRHLVWSGVLSDLPMSLTRNRYLEIERKFGRFSRTLRIPTDELDLVFWSLQTGEILK